MSSSWLGLLYLQIVQVQQNKWRAQPWDDALLMACTDWVLQALLSKIFQINAETLAFSNIDMVLQEVPEMTSVC